MLKPKINIIYPPFKNGLYLEEYYSKHNTKDNYIDVFWTNIQITPKVDKNAIQKLIDEKYNENKKYFTLVQHDDGITFKLPKNTFVFGAGGTGDIPIPLIYEDTTNYLENLPKKSFHEKTIFCSFIGSETHKVRKDMINLLKKNKNYYINTNKWTNDIKKDKMDLFVETTLNSKFALAPRGYGRTSFRFYEILQLGSIPIYIWDDIEWLYNKENIDYSKFCISIHVSKMNQLDDILKSIDEIKYNEMLLEYQKIKYWMTLEGMTKYINYYIDAKLL
jgi:hypothetical protein